MVGIEYAVGEAAWRLQKTWTSKVNDRIPTELVLESVYFPPFFFMVLLGFLCASLAAKFFNLAGISRFFWHPALAFLALWVLFSSVLGLTIFPP